MDARELINKIPKIEKKLCCFKNELKDLDKGVSAIGIDTFNFNPTTKELSIGFRLSDNSIATLTTPINIGDFKPDKIVNTFSDLNTITNPKPFEFVEVLQSQGTKYLPGSLGGTYYGSGLYYWNGTEWKHDNDKVYKALQDLTGLLATKADVNHTHVKADITDFNESDYLKTLTDVQTIRPLKTLGGQSLEGPGNIPINSTSNVQGVLIKAGLFRAEISQTLYTDPTSNVTISWDATNKQPTYTVQGWGWHDGVAYKIDGNSSAIRADADDRSFTDGTFYFTFDGKRKAEYDMENYGSYFMGTLIKESYDATKPSIIVQINMGNNRSGAYLIHVIK